MPFRFPLLASRIPPILVAIVATFVYLNSLGNDFALDDRGVILRNPLVQAPDDAGRAFGLPYWPKAESDAGVYRPLAIVSYALDWRVSGGDARWFHAMNIVWNAVVCVLVWLLAAQLLAPAGALAAGLVFAVHPVHVESVANVVGRAECMAAAFVLGALLAHRKRSWLAPALLALGLLSKESAIVFVALALAADLLLAGNARETLRERRWLYAAYGLVIAAYGATLATVFHGRAFTQIAPVFEGLTAAERLLTALTVIPHYPRLLVAPFALSWDYSPRVIEPAVRLGAFGVVGLAIVLAYAAALARVWRRDPVLAFALVWVPIALAPVANILVPTGIALAERTLYLASVGVALAAGLAVERMGRTRPVATLAAAGIVLLLFAGRTWTRTPVWRNNQTLALSLLEEHPESYRAHQAVARVYAAMGRWTEAASSYETSRRLFPRDPTVYREAAFVAVQRGRVPEARTLLDTAITLSPGYREAIAMRAELALTTGRGE